MACTLRCRGRNNRRGARCNTSHGSPLRGTTLVYDGLFGLVKAGLGRDPLSGYLFLFVGKRRNAFAESRPLHSLQFLS